MDVVQKARKIPAMEAPRESSTHSVSNCCEIRARLAPKAERMESSVARSVMRAIRRFATFVQAIRRISTRQVISTSEPFPAGPASSSQSSVMVEGYLIL